MGIKTFATIAIITLIASSCVQYDMRKKASHAPSWKDLPERQPEGKMDDNIKCYTLAEPLASTWKQPEFIYNHEVAVMPKKSKVIVLIYNPILESQDGKSLVEYLSANDSREYSDVLAETINEVSGGYINYEIVDVIERNEFTEKVDGFKYTEESFLEARKAHNWRQPDRSDYRKIFERNNLIERCKNEDIKEIWIWGAGGFGYDELAMYIPNRYARFAPTANPWFYRPYEIPEEIGHTVWVMGFNYEVGTDNMLHSYGHRCESMLALVFGHGIWDKDKVGDDPWNSFTMLNLDHPDYPSQIGNIHVPPNGKKGYDYSNDGYTQTCAESWLNYPDLSEAKPRKISKEAWQDDHFGFQKWWMHQLPKKPGYTKWGYNNWWVYIANTDEDLPNWYPEGPEEFKINPKYFPGDKQ